MHEVVACSCREHKHIAGAHPHVVAAFTTEHQLCGSGGNAEHLMRGRVVVR